MASPSILTGVVDSGTGAGSLGFNVNSLANDLLIVFIERSFADTNQSAPSGWTQFSFSPYNDGSGSQCQVFWRRANDTATDDFAITDGGNHFRGLGIIIRNASRGDNPFDFVTFGTKTTASGSVTITGGTTSVNECLIISAFSTPIDSNQDPSSQWANSSLVSINNAAIGGTNAGDGGSWSYAYGTKATAGSVSNTTVFTTSSSTNCWCMLAIRPNFLIDCDKGVGNLLEYSRAFDNAAWTKGTANISANTTIAPDGSITADTISSQAQSVAQSSRPLVQQNTDTFDAEELGNLSIYAKPGNKSQLCLGGGSNYGASFDLTGNGSVIGTTNITGGTVTFYSATIEKVGDWYRCSIEIKTVIAQVVALRAGIRYGTTNLVTDPNVLVTFPAGDTIHIWGAQITAGSRTLYQYPYGTFSVTGNDATLSKASSKRIILVT